MPLSNLNNEHFSEDLKKEMLEAWDIIIKNLNKFTRNLTPKERIKYGSVSEQRKLVVMKVLEYEHNQPHLKSPDVDYDELRDDWEDRLFLAGFISRMSEAVNICNNIRITHDYDAYQNAKTDYKFTKYKKETDPGAGFEQKYEDLLQFMKTNGGAEGGDDDSDEEDTGGIKPAR